MTSIITECNKQVSHQSIVDNTCHCCTVNWQRMGCEKM